MILTEKAIEAIDTQVQNRLAYELKCSVFTVRRWLKENEENGDLTKKTAVQVISHGTGLQENEILTALVEN